MQRAIATPAAQPLERAGKSRSLYGDAARRFARNRVAVAGLVVLLLIIAVAVFAPLLALHDPTELFYRHKLEAPNGIFPAGHG